MASSSNAHDPTSPVGSPSTTSPLDTKITLETFRTLLGLPSDRTRLPVQRPPTTWWPTFLRPQTDASYTPLPDIEQNPGIYPTILTESHRARLNLTLYNVLTSGGLILQLLISALLILLASVPSQHHIALAVLGALNGVITGVLALVRGQGLPTRLAQYGDGLRGLRERVEWLERELEAGLREVRYREVVGLREAYEGLRGDEVGNRPDFWVRFGGAERGE
ncbi:hypothetical protein K458DRAFT_441399 [Lentithecium fluviatile CBS 122367]|uniref:SMODS and SLOG-associating 2TM effector domain-containing protein n=1 Tax=Lentithecium fluviatile CBS 122367 TaxID=1168545 RepID=A0A6G1J7T1_9PLEO|nr:hypothetical protein K458DRAFT_441399 [Lentithecium fluviatile CBS 122367]